MKIKLGSLTLKEIKKICNKRDKKGCSGCPLYRIVCDDLSMYYATRPNMKKEIDL